MSAALNSALARIRGDVRSMHAYAVQDAAGMVKLDAMENPFSLSPELQTALGLRLGAVAINRYPSARVNDLKHALARSVDLPEGCSLMLGNGSDELIALLALACDQPGASVLAPEPGFVMYAMSAQLQGLSYHSVPLTEDFELDEAAMLAAIAQHRPAITYLAYPNNPTANLWSSTVVKTLVAAVAEVGGLVVMDEAYQPFSSATWLDEIRAHPEANAHVLLMRTLSKFGLAGVRLGYMVGATPLVAEIDKVRPPYNVSVLNTECALFALEHAPAFAEQAADIRAQRGVLLAGLVQLKGVRAFKSEANMVLVRWPGRDPQDDAAATRAFEQLKGAGILVKNVSKMHPLLRNCLRLTVGTPSENQQLLSALHHCL